MKTASPVKVVLLGKKKNSLWLGLKAEEQCVFLPSQLQIDPGNGETYIKGGWGLVVALFLDCWI